MGIKSILSVTSACLAAVSFNVNAAIISADWKTVGDNLITQDTDSGLEWLELTATRDLSFNYVIANKNAGQEFEGWAWASRTQVSGFFDAFGGNNAFYNSGESVENIGLFNSLNITWGGFGGRTINFAMGHIYEPGVSRWQGQIIGNYTTHLESGSVFHPDSIMIDAGPVNENYSDFTSAHALVRSIGSGSSVVPIPAAAWLFGSGLLGLLGVARHKKV